MCSGRFPKTYSPEINWGSEKTSDPIAIRIVPQPKKRNILKVDVIYKQ